MYEQIKELLDEIMLEKLEHLTDKMLLELHDVDGEDFNEIVSDFEELEYDDE